MRSVTMLGLVRLLAQPRVMGAGALGASAALAVWQRWIALPEVALHPEPAGLDAALASLVRADLPPRLLTDAYLAAFAIRARLRLVSFDADFAGSMSFRVEHDSLISVPPERTGEPAGA